MEKLPFFIHGNLNHRSGGSEQCGSETAVTMEDWRIDYNEFRPHGAIGNKVPISLMKSGGSTSPPP